METRWKWCSFKLKWLPAALYSTWLEILFINSSILIRQCFQTLESCMCLTSWLHLMGSRWVHPSTRVYKCHTHCHSCSPGLPLHLHSESHPQPTSCEWHCSMDLCIHKLLPVFISKIFFSPTSGFQKILQSISQVLRLVLSSKDKVWLTWAVWGLVLREALAVQPQPEERQFALSSWDQEKFSLCISARALLGTGVPCHAGHGVIWFCRAAPWTSSWPCRGLGQLCSSFSKPGVALISFLGLGTSTLQHCWDGGWSEMGPWALGKAQGRWAGTWVPSGPCHSQRPACHHGVIKTGL